MTQCDRGEKERGVEGLPIRSSLLNLNLYSNRDLSHAMLAMYYKGIKTFNFDFLLWFVICPKQSGMSDLNLDPAIHILERVQSSFFFFFFSLYDLVHVNNIRTT